MRIKKLTCASWIGLASVFTLVAQAANTTVTNNWNVAEWTNGSTLETFEVRPAWATGQVVTNSPAWTNRYDRFWGPTGFSAGNHLVFSLPTGITITNTFSGAIIQTGVPIFIDMRCKLNPFDATQTPTIDPNTKLCFYSNEKSNLVIASYSPYQCITNQVIVDPSVYYSIMIRFATDKFDVFFNNTSDPTASLNATATKLSMMVISGDGEMDDLYVSCGDPRRTWTNAVNLVTLPGSPSAEQLIISSWVANQAATNPNLLNKSFDIADAEKFYLTDTAPTNNTFTGELGIASFSYNPIASNVTVFVTLKAGSGTATRKDGKINGILQLKGVGDYNTAKSGNWPTDCLGTTTILTNNFVNGVAKYTFKLEGNANTNKFFLPVIKSQVNQ